MLCWLTAVLLLCASCSGVKYENNWKSLDSRPLPSWFDEAKLGLSIYFGVYSVPSYSRGFQEEWFWYFWTVRKQRDVVNFMKANYRPDFTYVDFASMFTAELFDPQQWAQIFKASGAKYIAFTAKHHEAFTTWPSSHSFNWNSVAVGPKRDLVGELAAAIRKDTDIRFGVYYSLLEWFNPFYMEEKKNKWTTNVFARTKSMPEFKELVETYKPELLWSDGDWEAPYEYWNATDFLAWLYNESPVKDTVVVNDRWGVNARCKHGGYWNCNDEFRPGKLVKHKWECCWSIDSKSYGYRRNAPLADLYTVEELLGLFVETVSCGGNLLLNVGPTKAGNIPPSQEERLRQIGQWLGVNGEAIYASRPWMHQNDTVNRDVWYTCKKGPTGYDVYAVLLKWPMNSEVVLGAITPTQGMKITMLGYDGNPFDFTDHAPNGITVTLPAIPYSRMPCHWAWSLKITGLNTACLM